MPKKRLLILSLLITISLFLMTYQNADRHILSSLDFFSNALNVLHEIKSSLKNLVISPFKKILFEDKENKRLKKELSKLLEERQRYLEAIQENKNLKNLLSIKEKEPRYVTSAKIIAKSIDPWSNVVIIDKGDADGIKKDMIAITEKGLVGKILSVSSSYSYLLPVVDINFSVSARLQKNRTEGIISGTGFRKCVLKYVPSEEDVKKGDILITSGLDLLFPEGIPVGFISKVNKKGVGIFQDIEVDPFVDIKKTEFVTIIKRE